MRRTMDWSRLQHEIPFEKNFRWRGGQVSRMEGFADAVFALSLTLLVVSTEVPTSYPDLIATLRAIPAFALSTALLVMTWYFHFIHFRRYGLEDATTSFLNIVLLFVVLIYVYPLKFMLGFLLEMLANGPNSAMRAFDMGELSVGRLLAIYGIGFAAMYVVLALMGAHALRLREKLELNEVEVVMTRSLIATHCIQIGAGVLSVALALTLPPPVQGVAGFVYMGLPIVHPLHGYFANRQERDAVARMASGDPP